MVVLAVKFYRPEVLRRQRAEETRVYGENACQAFRAVLTPWCAHGLSKRNAAF